MISRKVSVLTRQPHSDSIFSRKGLSPNHLLHKSPSSHLAKQPPKPKVLSPQYKPYSSKPLNSRNTSPSPPPSITPASATPTLPSGANLKIALKLEPKTSKLFQSFKHSTIDIVKLSKPSPIKHSVCLKLEKDAVERPYDGTNNLQTDYKEFSIHSRHTYWRKKKLEQYKIAKNWNVNTKRSKTVCGAKKGMRKMSAESIFTGKGSGIMTSETRVSSSNELTTMVSSEQNFDVAKISEGERNTEKKIDRLGGKNSESIFSRQSGGKNKKFVILTPR
jgi:hypothetical protein